MTTGRLWCAGCAVAVALVALTGCSRGASSSPAAPVSSSAASVSATPKPVRPANRYIFGMISEENGSEWTVKGIRGNTYSVQITKLTLFGSLLHVLSRDQFKVGDSVRVAGDFVGTTVIATAVDHSPRATESAADR